MLLASLAIKLIKLNFIQVIFLNTHDAKMIIHS